MQQKAVCLEFYSFCKCCWVFCVDKAYLEIPLQMHCLEWNSNQWILLTTFSFQEGLESDDTKKYNSYLFLFEHELPPTGFCLNLILWWWYYVGTWALPGWNRQVENASEDYTWSLFPAPLSFSVHHELKKLLGHMLLLQLQSSSQVLVFE